MNLRYLLTDEVSFFWWEVNLCWYCLVWCTGTHFV